MPKKRKRGALTPAELDMLAAAREESPAEMSDDWGDEYGGESWRAALVVFGVLSPQATDEEFAELDAEITEHIRASKGVNTDSREPTGEAAP